MLCSFCLFIPYVWTINCCTMDSVQYILGLEWNFFDSRASRTFFQNFFPDVIFFDMNIYLNSYFKTFNSEILSLFYRLILRVHTSPGKHRQWVKMSLMQRHSLRKGTLSDTHIMGLIVFSSFSTSH